VCREPAEALEAVGAMLEEGAYGDAGRRVLVEGFLEGEEVSVFALTDGRELVTLLPSQDHKQAFDGDRGPNTGGMGAFAPWTGGDDVFAADVKEQILRPVIDGLSAEGTPFRGCLYAGLMATADGPRVVEFNCRFGDPETQAVLPLLEDDLGSLLMACARGELEPREPRWHAGAAVSVVLASGGYPGSYTTGHRITGIEEAASQDGVVVFHAGTRTTDEGLVTAGGRVLDVTAVGETLEDARVRAYGAAARIQFEGVQLRRDIGTRARASARIDR
jgi:phosphoribosylamine--glycine ligase